MTYKEKDQFIQEQADIMLKMLKMNGDLMPQVIGQDADGDLCVYVTQFTDPDHSKDVFVAFLRGEFHRKKIRSYAFFAEAWKTTLPKGQEYTKDTPRPIDSPNRKEILMMTYGNDEGVEELRDWGFVRDTAGKLLDLEPLDTYAGMTDHKSRFGGLLKQKECK